MSSGTLGTLAAYIVTTVCALLVLRRARSGWMRFLTAVVGLLPLCQTVLILRDGARWNVSAAGRNAEYLELLVSALCLAAIHFLNKRNAEPKATDSRLVTAKAEVPVVVGTIRDPGGLQDVPPPGWLENVS